MKGNLVLTRISSPNRSRIGPRREIKGLPLRRVPADVSSVLEKVAAEPMADGDEDMPRDAKIIKSLLKSMGVDEYEPRVVRQFLELWYGYIVDILTDSQVYSEHAGKSVIDVDDVKIATQAKVNFSFSQPPPREVLLELSNMINKKPLSMPITAGPGIALPPEQDTLISPNYQFAFPKKQSEPSMEELEEDEEDDDEVTDTANPVSNHPPQEQQQKTTTQLSENAQRVSFQIGAKRTRSDFE